MSVTELETDKAHPCEVAYRRGWIMAEHIPPTTKGYWMGSGLAGRPLGLNPYELFSDEYEAWNDGYIDRASFMSPEER